MFAFYTSNQKTLDGNGLIDRLSNLLKYVSRVFAMVFSILLICLTYYVNYINSGYDNVVKITLHNCKDTDKCEYIGIVTYRPYMSELIIKTTPLYPILNCPTDSCVQEQIFLDKDSVKSLEKL